MPRLFFAVTIAGLLAAAPIAAAAGDATRGSELARADCARCHNVEKGAGFKLRPPSFQSIAIYRTTDDIWARILSPSPHSGMPDTQWTLTPQQIEDLVAYITSLDAPVNLQQ